ncbi:MAG: ankyrin repeat domain-containing protein, partial [Thermoanaerobaculia bacterium]|nr:ankyrin repeat domain-containing protein [Thermoanaerobaculia bacterium]
RRAEQPLEDRIDLLLLVATANRETAIIEELVERGADVDALYEGSTPLGMASRRGALATARTLLQLGADPNRADSGGWTPLLLAVREGHHEMVAQLLESGAVTSATTPSGETVLELAERLGRDRIFELLQTVRR